MRWLGFLTVAITIAALWLSLTVLSQMSYKDSIISGYKAKMEDCMAENKHMRERLGVFYVPRKEKKDGGK